MVRQVQQSAGDGNDLELSSNPVSVLEAKDRRSRVHKLQSRRSFGSRLQESSHPQTKYVTSLGGDGTLPKDLLENYIQSMHPLWPEEAGFGIHQSLNCVELGAGPVSRVPVKNCRPFCLNSGTLRWRSDRSKRAGFSGPLCASTQDFERHLRTLRLFPVNGLSADDCPQYFCIACLFGSDCQYIAIQHGKVGLLAGSDRANVVLQA